MFGKNLKIEKFHISKKNIIYAKATNNPARYCGM